MTNGPGASSLFYHGENIGNRKEHISMETLKRYLRLIDLPSPSVETPEQESAVEHADIFDQDKPPSLAHWILSLWRRSMGVDQRILGDLHVHTVHSDGIDTVEEMVETAHRMGYHWIGLADHAPGVDHPYRLNVERFEQRLEASAAAVQRYPLRVFQAIEADLVETGVQDIPSTIVDRLDYVLISSHDPGLEQSDRVLRSLESAFSWSLVKGYAHPFWMLDFQGYKSFIAEAVALAVKHNIAVELNFYPDSIRANDFLTAEVRRLGGSILLSTDAHHRNALQLMRFAGSFLEDAGSVEVVNFRESPF